MGEWVNGYMGEWVDEWTGESGKLPRTSVFWAEGQKEGEVNGRYCDILKNPLPFSGGVFFDKEVNAYEG